MAAPYSWTFTTAAAPAAPAVSSVFPANNATGVAVGVKPAATFNQAVTGSSVAFSLKEAAMSVAGTASYDRPAARPRSRRRVPWRKRDLHGHGQRGHECDRPGHGRPAHVDVHDGGGRRLPVQRLRCERGSGHRLGQRPQGRGAGHEVPVRRDRHRHRVRFYKGSITPGPTPGICGPHRNTAGLGHVRR